MQYSARITSTVEAVSGANEGRGRMTLTDGISMDFGTLLQVAKQNAIASEAQKTRTHGYQTSSPPKIVKKKPTGDKALSENIKKFLAKRDEEERQKQLERQRKAEELMSKRDTKAKRKIEKMLKVIKSANKSVLDDATDAQDASGTTIEQDDYGYSSTVASQFYDKLMDKYKSTPEEPSKYKFQEAEKRTMSKEDLARAKARVKDALLRQQEEENAPRSRKRTSGTSGGSTTGSVRAGPDPYDPVEEKRRQEEEAAAAEKGAKKQGTSAKGAALARRQNAPKPEAFADLLKLAEKKQHEPIVLQPERKRSATEPERLMTKREKKEYEERQAFLKMKRMRDRIEEDPNLTEEEKIRKVARLNALRAAGKLPGVPPLPTTGSTGQSPGSAQKKPAAAAPPVSALPRIPKRGDAPAAVVASAATPSDKQVASKTSSSTSSSSVQRVKSHSLPPTPQPKQHDSKSPSVGNKQAVALARSVVPDAQKNGSSAASHHSSSSTRDKSKTSSISTSTVTKPKPTATALSAKQPSARPSSVPPTTATGSSSSSSSNSTKTRQFPPPDMIKRRPAPAPAPSRAPVSKKGRRVIDSDSEEYDSEMDDFIDDEDCTEDYSSAIKEIFGYDKSRYRNDQYDDDDYNMESSYAQQMREEYISKKIGIMEDLEDMRMEEEEKRRKMDKKKKPTGSKAAPSKRK
uniref:Protein SPT2 homolog n=1 Tax=Anopheles farauti TaxID=69004 RepID=A0A182QTW9_9DIPT